MYSYSTCYNKFNKICCYVSIFKTIFILPIVIKNKLFLIIFNIYSILLFVTSSVITSTEGQPQTIAVIILSIVVCLLIIICLVLLVVTIVTVHKCKKNKKEVPNIQVDNGNDTTDNGLSVHVGDSHDVVIKKSALTNLDKFNMAIMDVLIEIGKHEETDWNIQQRIQKLIHQLSAPARPPPPTRAVHFDGAIRAVCDSRSHPVNIRDLTESPRPAARTKSIVYYNVPQLVAKVEITQGLESQANPIHDTTGDESNELLTTLLQSELPETYGKFMELLELKTNNAL